MCIGVSSSSGYQWKEARRIVMQGLRDFGLGGRPMESRIQQETEHMVGILTDVCGRPYNIEPLLKKAVSNVISVLLFGERWEYDDHLYAEHIHISDQVVNIGAPSNPVWTFSKLKYIPGDPFKIHEVR